MNFGSVRPACRVSLCLALCLSLSTAPAAGAAKANATVTLQPQGPQTSGPVSVSLQNEINAAVDRGRAWLMAAQNADGGWGSNSCVRLTAVATLALAHNASPDNKTAVGKAGRWLLSPAATNAPAAFAPEAMALREIALQVAAPANPQRTTNFLWQLQTRSATNGFSPFAVLLIREAVAPRQFLYPWIQADTNSPPVCRVHTDCLLRMPAGGTTPTPDATNTLVQLASLWSTQAIPLCPTASTARQCWVLAHFINRAGGTLADKEGRVVDWRNDLAQKLVTSQTIDAQKQGNGFWRSEAAPADWASHPVAETAFALLALDEL